MGHELVLNVPLDVYQPLVDVAQRTGATPEGVAIEWLAAACRLAASDPFEKFIGAIPTDVPNWPKQHDEHLGRSLERRLRDESEGP